MDQLSKNKKALFFESFFVLQAISNINELKIQRNIPLDWTKLWKAGLWRYSIYKAIKNAPLKQPLAIIDPKIKTCFFLAVGFVSTNTNLFDLERVI